MLDFRIALYYGGHDDTHIEINCQIPTLASGFPQTQFDGENLFIVSHTSSSKGHNCVGIQLKSTIPTYINSKSN